MTSLSANAAQFRYGRSLWIFCSLLLVALVASPALGQLPTVVRVEEDWELVVGEPHPESVGPQVTCILSPVGNLDSHYMTLDINHQRSSGFVPGGIQLQRWEGTSILENRKFPNTSVLSTAGEVVRWTQSVRLEGNVLTFEITSGTSTTWGNFGGQGYLRSTVATTLANLNAYNPDVSVNNSGVGFSANRVRSLVLKRVRLVTSAGQILEDATVRSVYPNP